MVRQPAESAGLVLPALPRDAAVRLAGDLTAELGRRSAEAGLESVAERERSELELLIAAMAERGLEAPDLLASQALRFAADLPFTTSEPRAVPQSSAVRRAAFTIALSVTPQDRVWRLHEVFHERIGRNPQLARRFRRTVPPEELRRWAHEVSRKRHEYLDELGRRWADLGEPDQP